MIRIAFGLIAVVLLGVAYTHYFVCPCNVWPGGPLAGTLKVGQVDDWSFTNEVPLCQLEVNGGYTYSINVNCMSSERRLYISCSGCAEKTWAGIALENPDARMRLDDLLYDVSLTRVEDDDLLDQVWQARLKKIGAEPALRPDGWWTFNAVSR